MNILQTLVQVCFPTGQLFYIKNPKEAVPFVGGGSEKRSVGNYSLRVAV